MRSGTLAPTDAAPAPARPRRKKRRWLIALLAVLAVVGLLVGIKGSQIAAMINAGKKFVPPPIAVSSAEVEELDWPAVRSAVGSVVAVHATTLGSELPGAIREIAFESGSTARKGDLLVRIDTSTERAQLAGAIADDRLATVNLERTRQLRQAGAIAQAELEAAEARAKQTHAAIAILRAAIAKKTIRAPFDGRVGIREVELGQVVSPGTPIVSLQSVDPMYLEFQLPQQALAKLEVDQKVEVTVDAFPGKSWTGRISVINPEVDPSTRNVRIRATVPNRDGLLTPGMFANVTILSGVENRVIVIPATSLIFAPYGDSVFVLESGKDPAGKPATVVRQKFIRTGERRGDFVVVTSGLEPGERVVSGGAFKLRNGVAVIVDDTLAPPASVEPTPANN